MLYLFNCKNFFFGFWVVKFEIQYMCLQKCSKMCGKWVMVILGSYIFIHTRSTIELSHIIYTVWRHHIISFPVNSWRKAWTEEAQI